RGPRSTTLPRSVPRRCALPASAVRGGVGARDRRTAAGGLDRLGPAARAESADRHGPDAEPLGALGCPEPYRPTAGRPRAQRGELGDVAQRRVAAGPSPPSAGPGPGGPPR